MAITESDAQANVYVLDAMPANLSGFPGFTTEFLEYPLDAMPAGLGGGTIVSTQNVLKVKGVIE